MEVKEVKENLWIGSFWNRLIYPTNCVDETDDPQKSIEWVHEEVMKGQFPHFVVCMGFDNYHDIPAPRDQEILIKAQEHICKVLPDYQRKLLGFAHHNSLYFCGNFLVSNEAVREELIQRLEDIVKDLKNKDSIFVTIGLDFLPDYSIDAWRLTSQHAVVAQRANVRTGGGKVYVYSRPMDSSSAQVPILLYKKIIEELWSLVREGDLSRLNLTLNLVYKKLFEDNHIFLRYMRALLQIQIIIMGWAAMEAGVDSAEILLQVQDYLSQVGMLYDYGKFKNLITQAVTDFTSRVYNHYSRSSSLLVREAEEFINTNLENPLSFCHWVHKIIAKKSQAEV